MSAQPPKRRTESLFDNRYRYDHIYPRGRSGETLRAYDTHNDDHPVVIKRPAPQDAPPMRAGQEVSIRTEKQALERLSGHPVLTELRGSGSFRVGGQMHAYIVMDRARGQIVEDMVLEYAARDDYLPELETLVIIDRLLDLLAHAHDQQVIYNDVDAKHLFWDRATYQLQVIDWGNAVFLDDPGALASVNRRTDVYQCGELLYFILTGANRLSVEMEDDGNTFFVNFGPNAEHIPPRLQNIVTRAVHPDPKQQFGSILELRHALREHREPLERQRDEIVAHVRKRVRSTASQDELEELHATLQTALDMDPGYPEARRIKREIEQFLRQIAFQADLDAIRIYIESANWPRALSLLHDLQPDSGSANEALIQFLVTAVTTLNNMNISPPPAGFVDALTPLFRGDTSQAAHILLTTTENRSRARQAQWLVAEQLAVHMPDITLLRPHLVRLRHDLHETPAPEPVRELVDRIENALDRPPISGITGRQVIYERVIELLNELEELLEEPSEQHDSEQGAGLLASAVRARHAAQEIVTRLKSVGENVYHDPSRAGEMLYKATQIDPTASHFDALHDYFDEVHQAIAALSQFRPRTNGENLAEWFADVQEFIKPYLDDLSDPALHEAASALHSAATGWHTVVSYLALGRRQPTIDVLRQTADTIRPVNQHIAAWLGTLANRLPDASHAERLSPNETLANKLIEGWKAWDRGDGLHAARLGNEAHALANTEGERLAANRLRRMGDLLDSWASAGGYANAEATDQTEHETLSVLLAEEEHERRTFAEQMPNTNLYLRAMSRGIVAYMHQSSSAGWRALYMHYVLRGMLALFDDQLDEAEFWREVASKSFDSARTHRAFQILDRALTSRLLVQKAQRALNAVARPGDLEAVRQTINAPLAGEILIGVEQAVHLVNNALRSWSDGDFYDARQALDDALLHIDEALTHTDLAIEPFANWVAGLRDDAAQLQQLRLGIEQGAVATTEEPDPAILEAHEQIVELTQRRLGGDYAHQVRQWLDMYAAVLDTYTTQRLTRAEKLTAFKRHFASLFITRHPAYPLFRHWESLIEQLPPDETETETITLDDVQEIPEPAGVAYLEDDRVAEPALQEKSDTTRDLPWNWIIVLAVIGLIAIVGYAVIRNLSGDEAVPTPTTAATGDVAAAIAMTETGSPATDASPALDAAQDSPTPSSIPATETATMPPEPTATPFTIPTSPTPQATATPQPSATATPSITPTLFATSTLLPTRTPQAIAAESVGTRSGTDVLDVLASIPADQRPGPPDAFVPGAGDAWLLSTTNAGSGELRIELSPELLSQLFQPGAASTLRRADATLELLSADQAALDNGDVAFGLGAANTAGEQTIGQAQITGAGFVSLGLNQNGRFRSSADFPQQNPQLDLSIRRTNPNTLSFYVDERWLGDSVFLFPQGDPLTLILSVTGRDVVVEVSAFEINYSPRDEIP